MRTTLFHAVVAHDHRIIMDGIERAYATRQQIGRLREVEPGFPFCDLARVGRALRRLRLQDQSRR